jgi:hypothetical protein
MLMHNAGKIFKTIGLMAKNTAISPANIPFISFQDIRNDSKFGTILQRVIRKKLNAQINYHANAYR